MKKQKTETFAPPSGFRPASREIWKPKEPGEFLHGHFLGTAEIRSVGKGKNKKDTFTTYRLALHETGEETSLSGACLKTQFEGVAEGEEVYVYYQGIKSLAGGHKMKDFVVYRRDKTAKR